MTEFWVSQGQKWCESCKIFIANNGASLAMHEQGKRHKEALALRIANVRKNSVTEEREKLKAARDLQQIEAAAKRQFARDVAEQQRSEEQQRLLLQQQQQQEQEQQAKEEEEERTKQELLLRQQAAEEDAARPSIETAVAASAAAAPSDEWVQHPDTGYYFNAASGYYYDADSGLYYSDILGKWTSQEEALKASRSGRAQPASASESQQGSLSAAPTPSTALQAATATTSQTSHSTRQTNTITDHLPSGVVQGPQQLAQQQLTQPKKKNMAVSGATSIATRPPGPVRGRATAVGNKSARGVASSLVVQPKGLKRKGEASVGPLSAEEVAAREEREAARRRVEERERSSLGLWHAYT
eukprot:TRINITY_DN2670_c0_g5_i1.p1 TRINITY_DN2670_c0_g5~~TRINITY_DN2670_c0_g5_i1.p1  ORF type:complete len:356 (-),score=103.32 TRINITY_DN2670_c0_g5_i1:136-1203(-)